MLKFISIIVLITFTSTFAIGADSAKSICFDPPTASKMLGDINYYKDNLNGCTLKLDNVTKQVQTSEKEITTLKTENAGVRTDLNLMIKAKDDYKELYTKTATDLEKERENKPSRLVWYSLGALSAMILSGVIAVLAAKR